MGKRTFNVIKDLDDIESVYPTTKNYVFTHDEHIPTLLAPLLDQDMIDCLVIQIAPVLLGPGIPLFTQKEALKRFQLTEVKQYGQFAEIVYRRI